MYTGNPHQDRNPFATKWRDRINTDRSLPPWRMKDAPKMYPGGTPPNPKNVYPTFPLPRREDSENWIPYGGGELNTGASMNGPLNPSGIQLAELTQDQMDYMGGWKNTPAFGGISKEGLWNNVKDMEYIRPSWKFWGEPSQEPTTRPEFNDYYNQLLQGKAGNWVT